MIVSEEEAKSRFCPAVNGLCKGAECMMWSPVIVEKMVNRHSGAVRDVWGLSDSERLSVALNWALTPVADPTRGSCGLRTIHGRDA